MLNIIVDLSHYQHVSDFARVMKGGIAAIIHKATQGTAYVDPTFADKRGGALDAGLLFGAYHFGTGGNPVAQADHLIEIAGVDSLLVLDFEANLQGPSMALGEAEQFVDRINQVTGRYPGLYSGHTIKEALRKAGIVDPSGTPLSKCWLWISQYAAAPVIPHIWSAWTMWQYTDGASGPEPHSVDGIGRCDRDQFNGAMDDLRRLWSAPSAIPSGLDATRVVQQG